jgi:hypothetical protein
MQGSTLKNVFLALIIASAVPLMAACSDDDDTPTSPTQPGPPVAEVPPPPAPTPDPPAPPPPPPTDTRPIESITGVTTNFSRTGEGGLEVRFRIDDFTIVRVGANTPVVTTSGGAGDTTHLLSGQTVTAEGRRDGGFLDATRVTIVSQP